jgi:hypothetical protein
LRKNVEMIRNARNINKTFETRENAYKLILFTFSSKNRNISEKVKKYMLKYFNPYIIASLIFSIIYT